MYCFFISKCLWNERKDHFIWLWSFLSHSEITLQVVYSSYIHLCSQSELTLRMRLTGVNSSLIIWKYWWNGRKDHFIWLLNLAILAPSEITPQVVYSSYIHLCSQSELTLRMRLTGVDSSLTTWQLNFSSSQHNFLILLMVREMIPIHNGVSTLFEVTFEKSMCTKVGWRSS